MRALWLYVLLLAALGGGAWLLWSGSPIPEGDTAWTADGADVPLPAGGAPLRSESSAVVGVWGDGAGTPTKEIDFAALDEREIRLRPTGGRLTGRSVLDALARSFGRDLPIRFPRRVDLTRFQGASIAAAGRLPADGTAEALRMPDVLEIVEALGFEATARSSFLMLTPRMRAGPAPPGGSERR